MNTELSVVILCYRAGKRAYRLVEKAKNLLRHFVPTWEILLVGNYIEGMEDDTPAVVKDIASRNENIKAVVMPKKGMMGWDARIGLSKARGRYICLIDGDEQMPIMDVIRVYKKISRGNQDLVKTRRKIRHDGILRKSISYAYNAIFIILFPGINTTDINSKPKIFTREVYKKFDLRSDDWFLDAEIMIQARRMKLKIATIPTKFYRCNYRNSFVSVVTIFEFLKNLYRVWIGELRYHGK